MLDQIPVVRNRPFPNGLGNILAQKPQHTSFKFGLSVRHTHVGIPMLGKKTSLNAATAAGIVLYELLRKYRILSTNAR
jgi:hypothetical protein